MHPQKAGFSRDYDQLDVVVELSALEDRHFGDSRHVGASGRQLRHPLTVDRQQFNYDGPSREACDPSQRLWPAEQRHELCYRFNLAHSIMAKINSSQAQRLTKITDHQGPLERLVEAELHLFKLAPSGASFEPYLSPINSGDSRANEPFGGEQVSMAS